MKYLLSVIIVFAFIVSSAFASVFTFTPRLSVSEEYTDNVDLTDGNEEEDFLTTISPGFTVEAMKKHVGVSLNYSPSYVMYKNNSEDDTWRHAAGLSFWADLSKNTQLTIRDDFLRTEESSTRGEFRDPTQEPPIFDPDTSIRRGRDPYYTNAASIGLNHQFGEKDYFSVGYLHSFLDDTAEDGNDNQRHAPYASVSYWFTPQYGMDAAVDYTRGEFDEDADYDDWVGSLQLNRMLTKHLSLYGAYSHTIREYREPGESDYIIYEPSVGFSYQFTKDMYISLGGGYFKQERDDDDDEDGFVLNADINKVWDFKRGSIYVNGRAGLDRNEFGTENLGFERYYGIYCGASYALAKRLNSTLHANYRRNELLNDEDDRVDNTASFGAGFSYTLTRWLFLRLNYMHNLLRSDLDGNDYDENVVILGVTLVPVRPYRYIN